MFRLELESKFLERRESLKGFLLVERTELEFTEVVPDLPKRDSLRLVSLIDFTEVNFGLLEESLCLLKQLQFYQFASIVNLQTSLECLISKELLTVRF